ncbi:hypothetical protein E2C01_089223 [Portunus trituberculatus]|uniref:Uncharacterized protein n=1 Tax=Portunus trituberculatus TaxID=210409 RepID=A0A5B7J879_PORTR|nr:hypothetical protein [Portunus trituberculatus]
MQITQPRPPVATGSTKKGVTHGPTTTTITATSPNMDSTLSLVKQLVTHFVEDSFSQFRLRDRDKEEAFKGKLKVLVYSILLSHRKGISCGCVLCQNYTIVLLTAIELFYFHCIKKDRAGIDPA